VITVLIELFLIFFIQSNIFAYYLHKHNEDHIFTWDLYFGTNIIALMITIILGQILHIFFPIYFFSLFIEYYLVYLLLHKNKEMSILMAYFFINICVAFGAHLIFSLTANVITIISIGFITGFSMLLFFKKRYFLLMYLIPVLWYLSALARNEVFLHAITTIFKSHAINVYLFDTVLVFLLCCYMMYVELRTSRLLFIQMEKEDHYERILKYRTQTKPPDIRVLRS